MMRKARRAGGFTLMEVLVALGVMAVGMIGILALQKGAATASGYSRRASEAAILGEDKLEELRTKPIAALIGDSDTVDAAGVETPDGPFTRTWDINWVDDLGTLVVSVTWNEGDGDHTITYRTVRNP